MSFFENLAKKLSTDSVESVAFIEIGATSVGGAYARYEHEKPPALIYTKRVALAAREGETIASAAGRALTELGDALIKEGAPALARAVGAGNVHTAIAAIGAPWQEASIRVEKLESTKSFTFTHSLLKDALARSSALPAGRVLADESVIATMLNGYETNAPYGRRVERASIVILAASVDQALAETVAASIRSLYHTHETKLTSLAHAEYASVRVLFPHEEEYLVIETRGGTTSLMIVKRNLLVGAVTLPPASDWLAGLKAALDALSTEHPLPHTIFLLAEEAERADLKTQIEQARFDTFWLVEGAPRVIAITPEMLAPLITQAPEAGRDLFLALLALSYAQKGGVA